MNAGQRFDIRTQRRVFDDFFKIEEIVFVHERYDGNMSGEERRLVFERGDAVAVLLFDATARSVVLVEQFRLPALVGRRRQNPATTNGQIVELVAGMINEGETAEQAALREVVEETGYRLSSLTPIGNFFSSPGGSSERVFLYFAPINETQPEPRASGIAGEEDIKVLRIGIGDLFDRLTQGAIDDSKLAIAAYWLKDHIGRL
jgi:nudix-type nucleoside diphosphatase (YffH/AdpP family)